MKATKLLLAAVVFTGLASLSIAGPGSDYWAQQTMNSQEQKAKQEQVQNQPKSDAPTTACNHCCGCSGLKKS